jgi:nitrogen fixation protein NifU and related proteins
MLPNNAARLESDGSIELVDERGVRGSLESIYGPIVVDHISNPRNVGILDGATGVGTVDDTETENLIIIYIQVENGRIQAASFRALACSACIAASSMATVLLTARPLSDTPITADLLLDALGGLPEAKRHCAELVARAANLALAF